MAAPAVNPLGQTDLNTLNTVLQSCAICQQVLAQCQAAGMNVQQQQADLATQQALASGLKAAFFPGKP